MTPNPDDEVVRVAYGELVDTEMYQQALAEEGIESKVVGQDLDASFGSALQGSMELYVRESVAERALAIIRRVEEEKGRQSKPE
jgi:Putative prokaryotic signal transducing protein